MAAVSRPSVRDPGTLLKVDTRLRRKRKLYEPASL
jgi:hypothetical protein